MQVKKNHVVLEGRLGADPQLVCFESGNAMVKCCLLVNEGSKEGIDQGVDATVCYTLIAWGDMAKSMSDSLFKGAQLQFRGALLCRTYVDKDGVRRYVTEVVIKEYVCLSENPVANAA